MTAHPFRPARYSPVLLAMLWLGCSSPLDPTTRPDTSAISSATETVAGVSPSKGGSYPLAVGNRWSYRRVSTVRMLPFGEPFRQPDEFVSTIDREIECIETLNGREYATERDVESTFYDPITRWRRYRQDASGLYELDGVTETPPACLIFPEPGATTRSTRNAPTIWDRVVVRSDAERRAVEALRARVATMEALRRPGSDPSFGLPVPQAHPDELTRLRYPLQIKSKWMVRNDPTFQFSAEVTGLDALDLPAGRLLGHRIRYGTAFFGPVGTVTVWYGPAGYLQLVAHLEVEITDIEGNPTGIAVFDEIERLTDFELAQPVAGFPPPLGGLPK